MPYARAITLRTCGRLTVVASDFGSRYRTQTHVTSEALYASLTHGRTWNPHLIDLKNDLESFVAAYNVAQMPVWFLPGVFVTRQGAHLTDADLDTTVFNVVHEFYPSTSQKYALTNGVLRQTDRPFYVPTYGTIEAVKPDRRLATLGFSHCASLLENYTEGQTFLLGKKRTMVQIVALGDIVQGVCERGECVTPWLQLPPEYGGHFRTFEILAGTMRYILLRGITRDRLTYVRFAVPDGDVCLPDFYLDQVPFDVCPAET